MKGGPYDLESLGRTLFTRFVELGLSYRKGQRRLLRRVGRYLPESELNPEHFFVVNKEIAQNLLLAALDAEVRTRNFYREMAKTTEINELKEIYLQLALFEQRDTRAVFFCAGLATIFSAWALILVFFKGVSIPPPRQFRISR